MNIKKEIIGKYFRAWIDVDAETVRETFSDDVVYCECYGPEYHGLAQIIKWFEDWNQKGRVLQWTVKRMLTDGNTVMAEWYFEYDYDGNVDGFDGVTLADFNAENKIVRLCEFQSKAEHCFPYGM